MGDFPGPVAGSDVGSCGSLRIRVLCLAQSTETDCASQRTSLINDRCIVAVGSAHARVGVRKMGMELCAQPKSKSLLQTGDSLSIRTAQESTMKKIIPDCGPRLRRPTKPYNVVIITGPRLSCMHLSICMILQVENKPPIRTSQRPNGPIFFRNSAAALFVPCREFLFQEALETGRFQA